MGERSAENKFIKVRLVDNIANSKLLSITIPTYDRLNYLLENLKHLLPQINKYNSEVELIISDNCSPHDPKDEIFNLGKVYGVSIHFVRQRTNNGMDLNIEAVTALAKGDYLFILGDDDILSPNFLDIIIPILQTHKYGAIHYGRLVGDGNCSKNKIHNPIFKDTILELSASDFIKEYLSMPNLLSSIIVEKDVWIKGKALVKKEYYGYNWFANDLFGIIEVGKPCLGYYLPLLLMRNPSRVWSKYWPIYAVVGLGDLFKDLDIQIPGVYSKWIERLHDKRYYNLPLILSQVYESRDYYREKKLEFYPHLTKKEQRFYNFWIWTPIPRVLRRIQFKIDRLNQFY